MNVLLFIINGIMFLFNGTPKKTFVEELEEGSRILRTEYPRPRISKTEDANAHLSQFEREVEIAKSKKLRTFNINNPIQANN
jgi:hypothetical protein